MNIDYKSQIGKIDLFIVVVIIIAFLVFFIFIFQMLNLVALNNLLSHPDKKVAETITEQNLKNLTFLFSFISAIGNAATGVGFFMIILQFRLAQKSNLIAEQTYINSLRPYLGTGEPMFKWLEDRDGKRYYISIKNYGNTPAIVKIAYLIWSMDKIEKEILFSNDLPPGYHRTYLKHSKTAVVYPNTNKGMNFERDQKKEGYFGVVISYNYFTNQIGIYGITYAYDKEKDRLLLQNEWID